MSIFVLKIIAMITMVIDHARYLSLSFDNDITRFLGRWSFVLFAFILTEGLWHTKNRARYLKRVVLFAVVSQIPFMLFRTLVGKYVLLNIMFSFSFAMITIILIDKYNDKRLKVIIGLIGVLFSLIVPIDYGFYGFVLTLIMYYTRKTKLFNTSFIIINILYYIHVFTEVNNPKEILPYLYGSVSSIILLNFYNGKLGKKVKFLYWFYPVHMLIIYLIYLVANNLTIIGIG